MGRSWEFDLRIELSVVRSQAPTFDPGLVKQTNITEPNSQSKRAINAPNKKGVLAFTDA